MLFTIMRFTTKRFHFKIICYYSFFSGMVKIAGMKIKLIKIKKFIKTNVLILFYIQ